MCACTNHEYYILLVTAPIQAVYMALKRPPPQKLEFHARIWASGDRLLIPISKDMAHIYDLEGKFAKITLEVVGAWRLSSRRKSKTSPTVE